MQKEIGSNFDLNPEILWQQEKGWSLQNFGINGSDNVLLSTGRSAETLILDEIEFRDPKIRKKALIPPFTCHTVIEPFINKGYSVQTYSIDRKMKINGERFRNEIYESDAQVVLIHQYFGFCTVEDIEDVIREASKRGIVFIEDRTQCLYSDFPVLPVDYVIGSMRKWAALPDGGFAVCRHGKIHAKPKLYDKKLERKKLEASEQKYRYLHEGQGNKQAFLKKFQMAENILDNQEQYFTITPTSIKIQQNLNINELKRKRRENYEYLYEGLKQLPHINVITSTLKENEVPLYCICLVRNRKNLQEYLREYRIYAPIVWPKSAVCSKICEEAQELYECSLCIPIDQRYDLDDMDRIIRCVREYERGCQGLNF